MPFIDDFFTGVQNLNIALATGNAADVQALMGRLMPNNLRVFVVGSSAGIGHQGATVIVIDRLITLGYVGTIEVLYAQDAGARLALLIPGFQPGVTENMAYKGATLAFEVWDAAHPPAAARQLGVTGGLDPGPETTPPPTKFNVDVFLQLQPFGWEAKSHPISPNQLWIRGVANPINLSGVAMLGNAHFDNLAFAMPDPALTPEDWVRIRAATPVNDQANLDRAQVVIDHITAANPTPHFLPSYGLLYPPGLVRYAFAFRGNLLLAVLFAAIRRIQSAQIPRNARPAVVVLIGSDQAELPENYMDIRDMVARQRNQGRTVAEIAASDEADNLIDSTQRAQLELVTLINQAGPTNVRFSVGDTLPDLRTRLTNLRNDQILVVVLAPLSPLVFNQMLATSTLPFIFEGQGTANLALNLGAPFFKMANASDAGLRDVVYQLPFMPPVRNQIHGEMSMAIKALCGMAPGPLAEQVDAVREPLADTINPNQGTSFHLYFAALRAFYHGDDYDKVILGLRYAMTQVGALQVAPPHLAVRAATGDDPLPPLYDALVANLSNGTLDLSPGAIPAGTTPIVAALVGLFPRGFTITGAAIDFPPPQTTINVTGDTTSFGLVSLATQVVFTLDPEVPDPPTLQMQAALIAPSLTLPGAPWFSLDAPTVSTTVSDSGIRNYGAFTASLTLGTTVVTVTAELPTATTLSAAIDFTANPPSIASVFQLLGGVDLTQSLPPPLDGLAGLSLQGATFAYDYAAATLVSFGVDLVTHPQWHLFGNVTLDTLRFSFTVEDPTGTRAVLWQASSDFVIGPGTITVSVSYPDLSVGALLADDSEPIPIANLVSFFLGGAISVPISGDLTNFSMLATPGAGAAPTTYSVQVTIEGDWPVPSASLTVFTVESLGFDITGSGSDATGSITGKVGFFESQPEIVFDLTVRAAYEGAGAGWVISGTQGDRPIQVSQILTTYIGPNWFSSALPDFALTGFSAELHPGGTTDPAHFILGGGVSMTLPFGDITLDAKGKFGKAMGSVSPPGYPFAHLSATTKWNGIELDFGFDYAPDTQAYTVQWRGVIGAIKQVEKDGSKHWIASLSFADGFTLGDMVATFVSWVTGYEYGLAAPWNLLEDIKLSGLELTYDFTAGTVGLNVDVGPIELGFARVDKIGLAYDSTATPKLKIVLDGRFIWADDPGQLSWDPTQPGSTQVPPGNGSEFLDLRLLAMGQHVRVPDIAKATTMQEAIKALAALPPPSGDKLPAVKYAGDAGWLIGTDFGVLMYDKDNKKYAATLQIVFADPDLYGLRIVLDGPPAKILGGLDFQILYRKISDTVGVYQAELALPTALRTIQAGIYTIQLPVIAIAVYTNGDFLIDIGFPWKADFARSFTVQAIIYPGIPLLGSGGLYFGKLSSATTNKVPKATNGTFHPVIVFGFGAQVGFGKSVTIGPLSAGFSLTVLGIIEGTIARWNPYSPDQGGVTTQSQLDGTYFYSLSGTFGIAGTLNGQVDFAIVKAKVNIVLLVTAQITFTSYQPIVFTVQATVDVSASIEIDLGLFSISISFHFSLSLKQSFMINPWTDASPPWHLVSSPPPGRLGAPLASRLSALRHFRGLRAPAPAPVWTNLIAPAIKQPLTGYLSYALTAAGDAATALAQQLTCYVATLVVDAPVPPTTAAAHVAGAADTSFDALAKLVTRWVIAAFRPAPMTGAQVDALVLDDDTLAGIAAFLADDHVNPQPVPGSAFDAMLAQQVALTLWGPQDGATKVAGAYFPMPPGLSLAVAAYGGAPALGYRFADYNTLSDTGIGALRSYFDQLAVQVDREEQKTLRATAPNAGESVASFVFADFALFVARQMISAIQAALRDFHHTPASGETPDDVVTWILKTGQLPVGAYTRADVFAANPGVPLRDGASLVIRGASAAVGAKDNFTTIAARARFGAGFTASALALANATGDRVLQQGASITIGGVTAPVDRGDSLTTMAGKLGVSIDVVVADPGVLANPDLLMTFATLALPDFATAAGAGTGTLDEVAAAQGITVAALAEPDANGGIRDLFWDAGTPTQLDLPHLPQFPVGALLGEAQDTGQIAQLAAIESRYHLHGLRLPTTNITPNTLGMWVQQSGSTLSLPPVAGMYALTGQQFPIPPLTTAPLAIAIGLDGGPAWVSAKNGTKTVPFSVSAASGDAAGAAVVALRTWITTHRLDTGVTSLGARGELRRTPASFGLGSHTAWIAEAPPALPYGPPPPPPATATAQIWRFPDALSAILDHTTHDVNPTFAPYTQTYDEATGTTTSAPIASYGWATTLTVTVKRVPPPPAGTAGVSTYEVVGALDRDVVVLEDLVAQVGDAAIAGVWIGTAPAPGLGTDGLAIAPAPVFAIGQANLSTVTHPGAGALRAALAGAAAAGPVVLGGPSRFLRLLWEASITASGGFFLYYQANGAGLPDSVFDVNGQASITVIVVYAAELDDQLYDCTTSIVIGDPIDLSRSAVTVDAVAVPTVAVPAAGETLGEFAARAYTDLADLAADNLVVPLATGATVTIAAGMYLVSPLGAAPGGSLAAIAAYFGVTGAQIIAANPRIPAARWQAPLPADTAIRLPSIDVLVGTSPGGAALGALATYYGADPAAIVVDNRDRAGLYAAALRRAGGPVTTSSTLPIGSQALRLSRPVAGGGTDPQSLMLRQFSLLGYQVVGNQDFTASNLGVPVGPTGASGTGVGKRRVPNVLGAGDSWTYELTLGYQDVIAGKVGTNPYQAVGRLLQLDLAWLDLFGNTILSDLTAPALGASAIVNEQPLLVGYTDPLVGVGQWPSVNATWQIGGAPRAAALALAFTFDPTRYTGDQGPANATNDLAVYQTLAAQLADPAGVAMLATCSLVAAALPVAIGPITTWAGTITAYLTAIAGCTTPPPPAPAPYDLALALPALVADPIVELSASITLARAGGVVEGAFASVPGLRAATTALTPTGARSQAGLEAFATAFEAALAGTNAMRKVAYGPDRFAGGAASSATLWAVTIGVTDGTPLRYRVTDAGAPGIFAPAPISTALISRGADLYPYVSGKGIDYSKPTPTQFAAIDLDQWVRTTFAIVDGLLQPGYLSPLLILDQLTGGTALDTLLAHKAALAQAYAAQMTAVFETQGPAPDAGPIQEAFRQSMLAQLGNAYQVQAGLTYHADVAGDAVEVPPPTYDGPVPQTGIAVVPGVTLSPVKLPLATADGVALPMLVATPTQNGADPQAWASIELRYTPTAIEHQIGTVPGIAGYQASSWLRFVLPPPADPSEPGSIAANLGAVDVPLPLRGYPASPVLDAPTGTPTNPGASAIEAAIEWTYAGAYVLPVHYPQDTVSIEIAFNVEDPGRGRAISLDDVFPALAELVSVFPAVAVDLDGALATLTMDAAPPQLATAAAAIGAVNTMLENVVGPPGARRLLTVRRRSHRFGSASGDVFAFTVREDAETVEGQDGVLVVTVAVASGPAPAIGITGYTAEPLTTPPPPGQVRYVYRDAKHELLPASTGQNLGPRLVSYAGLSILKLQDAVPTARVFRNDHLSPDPAVQTSERFIYRTPEVTLARPIVPSISSAQPIDIALIGSPDNPPVARSLTDHLTALFAALLAGAEQPTLDVQLVTEYRYTLNSLFAAAPLTVAAPILMQPPLIVSTAPVDACTTKLSLPEMIADLAAAITGWFTADPPSSADGQLGFVLTILTTLTSEPRPLITLTGLSLDLADIYPPLPVGTGRAASSRVSGT